MQAADPEQRLRLAAQVAQGPVQLERALEQREFGGVLDGRRAGAGALVLEAGVQDPATGQRGIGLDGVQIPLGIGQDAGIAAEDRPLVQRPGPLDPIFGAHRRPRPVAAIDARPAV